MAVIPPLSSDASISALMGAIPEPVAKIRIFENDCEERRHPCEQHDVIQVGWRLKVSGVDPQYGASGMAVELG